jgi:SAM-dependent methyltransferase
MSTGMSTDEALYAGHWGKVYAEDASQRTREWHCSWEEARPFAAPFLARASASRRDGTVLDVGCGGSSMGHDVWRDFDFAHLVMTDIDPGIMDVMRERYASSADAAPRARTVRCEVADARRMPILPDASVSVVVDKGTLDALHGDQHKLDMIRECARVLDVERGGIIVSISFPAAARVALLERAASELNLDLRVRVFAEGDPKYGHAAVFVAVLGRGLEEIVPAFVSGDIPGDEARGRATAADALTATVLARVRASGSLIEDEPPGEEDELTLFDASDSE